MRGGWCTDRSMLSFDPDCPLRHDPVVVPGKICHRDPQLCRAHSCLRLPKFHSASQNTNLDRRHPHLFTWLTASDTYRIASINLNLCPKMLGLYFTCFLAPLQRVPPSLSSRAEGKYTRSNPPPTPQSRGWIRHEESLLQPRAIRDSRFHACRRGACGLPSCRPFDAHYVHSKTDI